MHRPLYVQCYKMTTVANLEAMSDKLKVMRMSTGGS